LLERKPQKYGILFKSINAVEYPYTFVSHCYASCPGGTPNQYYIRGTDEYTKYLIAKMATQVPLAGIPVESKPISTHLTAAEYSGE